MNYDLERFVRAQDGEIEDLPPIHYAYEELTHGKKQTHWIWYVFPQIAGLGHSDTSNYYSIKDICEAVAYLQHPILSWRLSITIKTLMMHKNKSISSLFPLATDRQKVHASLTLFDYICPDEIFDKALNAFFGGKGHLQTLKLINHV